MVGFLTESSGTVKPLEDEEGRAGTGEVVCGDLVEPLDEETEEDKSNKANAAVVWDDEATYWSEDGQEEHLEDRDTNKDVADAASLWHGV